MNENESKKQEALKGIYNNIDLWMKLQVEDNIKQGASKEDALDFAKEELMDSLSYDYS
jgi:hypothetical protein